MAGRTYIGTSGWAYKGWKADWYGGAPTSRWLPMNAERFTAVEIDASFYRLQSRSTFEKWARQTPPGFRFALRGSRFTTHNKKLIDAPPSIDKQREPAEGLGEKLACVLWQLPPRWRLNLDRLESFLTALHGHWGDTRHAIEFRHESWMVPETAELLGHYRVANCISDAANFRRWDAVTTDVVYVRLHGKPRTYASNYDSAALDEWARRVLVWLDEGRDVHVYFDNDIEGHAPRNAVDLIGTVNARRNESS